MFYALGSGDYLNDKIESAVMVGPCLFGNFVASYEKAVEMFKGLHDIGVYSLGGDDWSEKQKRICDNLSEEVCNFYGYYNDIPSPGPVGTLYHLVQNGVEDRSMERIPIEQYAAGQRSAPALEYEDLDDSFLINFVVGENDTGCDMNHAKRIARDLSDAHTAFHTELGLDHNGLALETDAGYVDRIVGYIEEGAEYARHRHGHHDDGDGMSTMVWDMIFGTDGASALVTSSALALSALVLASY